MITYPIDVENTRWSVWSISQAAIVKHNIRWPRADGGEIVNADPDFVPLLEVEEAQPAYDPATQTVQRSAPVVDVNANTHTHAWVIRALTQEELDDNATNAANEVERSQAKAVYADLKNGVGTQIERLERLEKVAAHLLKVQYGDVA